ncbi:TPA: thioredoxin [archaeon]|nr:thioredoxin [Candidatus Naiadarchaeales archaeon SRR2090153.bin1042]
MVEKKQTTGTHPLHIGSSDFDKEVINSKIPVVVDFWASWCGPCKMIAPTLEDLAKEYSGEVKFVKVQLDELGGEDPETQKREELAASYGVMSIPNLIFFKDGVVAGNSIGAVPKETLKQRIDEAFGF